MLSNTATPIYYGRFREQVIRGEIPVCQEISMEMNRIDDLIANVGKIGYLPEGAIACKYVHEIAEKKDLKLPLCDGLYKILNGTDSSSDRSAVSSQLEANKISVGSFSLNPKNNPSKK